MEGQKEVSAIGYSVRAAVGESTEIVFQHFIAADATDEQVNADLDRLMKIVARQRALGEVPGLKEERAKLLDQQAQTRQDEVRLDAEYEENVAKLQETADAAFKTGYDEYIRSGRQGEYKPKGAVHQTVVGCARDLDKLKNERSVVMQARDGFHRQVDARVATIEEKLAKAAELGAT